MNPRPGGLGSITLIHVTPMCTVRDLWRPNDIARQPFCLELHDVQSRRHPDGERHRVIGKVVVKVVG